MGRLEPGQARKTEGHGAAGKFDREADNGRPTPARLFEHIQMCSSFASERDGPHQDGKEATKLAFNKIKRKKRENRNREKARGKKKSI